ncbi:SsgA family sporulation/cell division regulator [Streptomyces sp. NPDC047097]|uniref:SsgA family sporulation/cell division regulator n=1 Tax=Streptomyces sp. NPDC047097 TaxID=3155260 RepID=UPI0033E83715
MTDRPPTRSLESLDTLLRIRDGRSAGAAVSVTFRYDAADPFAVTVDFTMSDRYLTSWTFARELLGYGMFVRTGEGDVTVWSCFAEDGDAVLFIRLRSSGGRVVLEGDYYAIAEWLERCYALVPEGAESMAVDWDRLLADSPPDRSS